MKQKDPSFSSRPDVAKEARTLTEDPRPAIDAAGEVAAIHGAT
jgi:hypothetical protein